jgi:flagellar biosynthesis chaperone FliJ
MSIKMVWEWSPHENADCLIKLGEDWADKNAAASALEKTEDSTHAEAAVELKAAMSSHEERKLTAKKSSKYRDHLTKSVEARREANKARVRYDTYRAYIELLRSEIANRREEMRHLSRQT